ncbi:MAG: hypothetical protein LBV75_02830 [Paludibacter sp.]|nr:hypothetical protein [Paludibacter sp.]
MFLQAVGLHRSVENIPPRNLHSVEPAPTSRGRLPMAKDAFLRNAVGGGDVHVSTERYIPNGMLNAACADTDMSVQVL